MSYDCDYDEDIELVMERLVRIESRLCQLMMHMGLDPNTKEYQQTTNQKEA